ncbi:hypothetical protein BGZ99_005819 [Dissophora globulifera]|uniref:Major facilitator superfamily (MFS) profile domain-containing protein n=1 Tax=Dissophora globulifera TaxID=979702 RepID=A0A9P6RE36_9FUNG|nr:hypothetical protein BGZ99_005819 [Dissophora globulifera]
MKEEYSPVEVEEYTPTKEGYSAVEAVPYIPMKEEYNPDEAAEHKQEVAITIGENNMTNDTPEKPEQNPVAPPTHTKPPPRQFVMILIALALCVFIASLDQIIVATSIPAIAREFDSLYDISWLGTAYLMTLTSFQPLYGKVSDVFGRKATLLFANFMFLVGSAIAGWAVSMNMLIVGRAVQGVGAGGLIAMVFIVLSDMLDMRERGKYLGSVGAIYSVSSVIGPLLGGAFADHVTWRWCFWINLPIGAICMITIFFFLNLPTPPGSMKEKIKRIDFYGSFLLMLAVILILLPLSWGGSRYAWKSGIIIGLLCAGFIVAGIFVLVEWKVPDEPIVPIHLFKFRNIWSTYGALFFTGMSFFGILFYLPVYFQVVKGESATIGGLETIPFILGLTITSLGSGVWALKKGTYAFFPAMGNILFIAGSALCILFDVYTKRVVTVFVLMLCGLAVGFTTQSSTLAVQAAVKPKYMATVTALVQFVRSLGQVFGVAIMGSVFNNKLEDSLVQEFPTDPTILRVILDYSSIYDYLPEQRLVILKSFVHGLRYAFYCCVAFCVIAFVISCFIQHKELKTEAEQAQDAEPDMAYTPVPAGESKEQSLV